MTDDFNFMASERRRQRQIDTLEEQRRARREEQRSQLRQIHRRRRLGALAVLGLGVGLGTGAWVTKAGGPSKSAVPAAPASTTTSQSTPVVPTHVVMPAEVRGVHVANGTMETGGFLPILANARDGGLGLNAVQIDIKNEEGQVGFTDGAPALAQSIGAATKRFSLKHSVQLAHERGIYVIGRIASFHDPVLARAHQDQALRTKSGGLWVDRNSDPWLNPRDKRNWSYIRDLAKAATAAGVDEIQLDYVRYPDYQTGAKLPDRAQMEDDIAAYVGNLGTYVRESLHSRLSIAVFGLAGIQDLGIGQNVDKLAPLVDVLSPMVYPQTFGPGELGIDNPALAPGALVSRALAKYEAKLQSAGLSTQLRPWLEDYPDGTVQFGQAQVEQQITAARGHSTSGYLLWNSGSQYNFRALSLPAR